MCTLTLSHYENIFLFEYRNTHRITNQWLAITYNNNNNHNTICIIIIITTTTTTICINTPIRPCINRCNPMRPQLPPSIFSTSASSPPCSRWDGSCQLFCAGGCPNATTGPPSSSEVENQRQILTTLHAIMRKIWWKDNLFWLKTLNATIGRWSCSSWNFQSDTCLNAPLRTRPFQIPQISEV